MLYISDNCTDPYRNLAEEEYLLKEFTEPLFRLWQNDNSIIVGRYQNTLAEIDYDYVRRNGIKVVRRLSGGGAVFHDLGNLNFTFIQRGRAGEDTAEMFRHFTKPVIEALNSLGVKAYLEGRNDLLIDGRKFSGNAICIWKERILQHGTLLYDTSMSSLSAALSARPEKFIGKAVQSNRMRVTNIKDHIKEGGDLLWFRDFLGDYICSHPLDGEKVERYHFTPQQERAIDKLRDEKYATDAWNFGHSPKFKSQSIKKFPGGLLEFYYTVEKGILKELEVRGDYFFTLPTEEFVKIMTGTPFTKEELWKKISATNCDAFFSCISKEEILSMFF